MLTKKNLNTKSISNPATSDFKPPFSRVHHNRSALVLINPTWRAAPNLIATLELARRESLRLLQGASVCSDVVACGLAAPSGKKLQMHELGIKMPLHNHHLVWLRGRGCSATGAAPARRKPACLVRQMSARRLPEINNLLLHSLCCSLGWNIYSLRVRDDKQKASCFSRTPPRPSLQHRKKSLSLAEPLTLQSLGLELFVKLRIFAHTVDQRSKATSRVWKFCARYEDFWTAREKKYHLQLHLL